MIASSSPYPAETPVCDNRSHSSVSKVKWNWSFGAPLGVVAKVFMRSK